MAIETLYHAMRDPLPSLCTLNLQVDHFPRIDILYTLIFFFKFYTNKIISTFISTYRLLLKHQTPHSYIES